MTGRKRSPKFPFSPENSAAEDRGDGFV